MSKNIKKKKKKKNAHNQHFWSFLINKAIKFFSDKILQDKNMTHPLENNFSKTFL